ncbi:heparan-alpha-glucosaminide N-acetyltransferase domain-containing protein [Arthrobacter castelli]|uniref:heparan-alpha-glucosaminide N-acetyltransferase domain-containing protein n=1 Tax=Arthrobacter castelli TaxID=271431 RepID=UPI00047BBCE7|nr:heparan-alpha-glucosaminide N-acetyltransferase domain-containing protein [Arthrobacter castelli]
MPSAGAIALSHRLTGIDAARGLALLGMMATHIIPLYDGGNPTLVGTTFSGKSSALFAVLAGVSIALYTGRGRPHRGEPLTADRRGLAVRALVVAVFGFGAGIVQTSIAIILVHYAFLFLMALPFAGLRVRPLIVWAAGWLLFSPVVAYRVRPLLRDSLAEAELGHNPVWSDLLNPATFATDIFFTGYYPVAQWLGYLLVGMVIGRLDLDSVPTQTWLIVGGIGVAASAKRLAGFFMYDLGGLPALLSTEQGRQVPLEAAMQVSLSPVEQSGSWWWLASAAPHSGTTLDLLHTSATTAAVIGLCLLATHWNRNLLLPLSEAGAITLTLYTAHIIALSIGPADDSPPGQVVLFWIYAASALVLGAVFALLKWRGPLESMTSTMTATARGNFSQRV